MKPGSAPIPIRVRPACEADAVGIARLSGQLGYPADAETMRQRLARIGARADHAVFVAERPGAAPTPLGWVHAACGISLESGLSVELLGLVVDGAARRCGVGRELVAAAERWSRERGVARMVVRSNVVRREAHAFYPTLEYTLRKTQRVYVKTLTR